MTLRVLDLFSGIGGFSLGLERAGMQTVAFCEIEEYPRQVLKKHWPDVPIFEDVRQLKGDDVGTVDVICGGYPCQPFSLSGERRGADDDRHLWPEVARLLREIKPGWAVFENVYGHITLGLDEVLSELEEIGYTTETFIIPACAVGLWHRRDRVWIIANRKGKHLQKQEMVDTRKIISEFGRTADAARLRALSRRTDQPAMAGVAHGISNWVDRSKALGNAVVPQIPEIIGRAIMAAEGF